MIFGSLKGCGLIIHHWDTDGVCSGALILDFLKELNKKINTFTPTIGSYCLGEKDLKEIKDLKPDFVIVADVCLPKEDVLRLKKIAKKIIIFDHNLQAEIKEVLHFNPISKGESPEKNPSTTWLVSQLLGKEINLLSVLGVFGDNGLRILTAPFIGDKIKKIIRAKNTTPEILIKITKLIDSNYKLSDRAAATKALYFVLDKQNSISGLLSNSEWVANLKKISAEVNNQLKKPSIERGNIVIKRINTRYHIISEFGRAIAWGNKDKIAIVINTGISDVFDQIYIRSGGMNTDLAPILSLAIQRKYKAGGKKRCPRC